MSQPEQQTGSGNPLRDYYQEWSGRTPFVTRCTMIGMVLVYILSFFIKVDLVLGNQPYYSVMHLEIYRLVLSPLAGNSILTLIMVAFFYPVMGTKFEFSMGSGGFLCLLGILTLATNIIFAVICLMMHSAGSPLALFWNCSGFWSVLFALIVIESLMVICPLTIDEFVLHPFISDTRRSKTYDADPHGYPIEIYSCDTLRHCYAYVRPPVGPGGVYGSGIPALEGLSRKILSITAFP